MSDYHGQRLATDAGGVLPVGSTTAGEQAALDQATLVATLDRIVELLVSISASITRVANDLGTEAKVRRRLTPVAAIASLCLIVLLACAFVLVDLARQNNAGITASKGATELLVECTTPSPVPPPPSGQPDLRTPEQVNKCAERLGIGQARNSDAVRVLNCVALLLHDYNHESCAPERKALTDAGIRLR